MHRSSESSWKPKEVPPGSDLILVVAANESANLKNADLHSSEEKSWHSGPEGYAQHQ